MDEWLQNFEEELQWLIENPFIYNFGCAKLISECSITKYTHICILVFLQILSLHSNLTKATSLLTQEQLQGNDYKKTTFNEALSHNGGVARQVLVTQLVRLCPWFKKLHLQSILGAGFA